MECTVVLVTFVTATLPAPRRCTGGRAPKLPPSSRSRSPCCRFTQRTWTLHALEANRSTAEATSVRTEATGRRGRVEAYGYKSIADTVLI
jgi:hypothetical protein